MNTQWPEIERLFFQALQVAPGDRKQWIAEAAGDRSELAAEVLTLLEAHDASEQTPPPRIGVYRLDRRIASGGMGEVWLASRDDGQFEQRVAIKLVRAGLGVDLLLPKFQQERQLLARLHHPHIANLLDGGVSADGRSFLAMEFVEGAPIIDFCDHRGYSLDQRVKLFLELCSAVEYAHRNLIVHCDIKPANVLVTADASVKLLDFGVARLTESGGTAGAATIPLLTPRYASPEQLRGDPVSTSTDVYSLGVVLFELLTGALPYAVKGAAAAEMITAVTSQEPLRASDIPGPRRIPPGDLDAILAKALEKDPARRYGSVESFSADLVNYLAGNPVSARPLTGAYRLQKYLRRHWAAVASVSAIVLTLAVATVLSLRAAHVADRERQRSERVQHFLEDVLSSANPASRITGMETGADAKLVDVMAAASQRLSSVFADEPGVQSELHAALGRVYIGLGKYDPAKAEVKAALERIGSLADRPGAKARVLHVVARLDYDMGKTALAIKEERAALDLFSHSPDARTDVQTESVILNNLGAMLRTGGKAAESRETLVKALELLEKRPSPPPFETAMLNANIGIIDFDFGQIEKARREIGMAVERMSHMPSPPVYLGLNEAHLAIIERLEGHSDRALAGLEKASADADRAGGPDNPISLNVRIILDYQLAQAGHAREVEAELTRCLELARGPNGLRSLALALQSLGYARTLAGHPREGEPLLREALARRTKAPAPLDVWAAGVEFDLADCLQRQGKTEEARAQFQSARDHYRQLLGPESWAYRNADQRLAQFQAAK